MHPYSSGFAKPIKAVLRARLWYVVVMMVLGVFLVRLFYLQIIKHDYYRRVANAGHLKEYEINAKRGVILAHDGNQTVPIVLDQTLYTIYADPSIVKDPGRTAGTLHELFGGDSDDYEKKLRTKDTRYVVLARKATKGQKDALLTKKYPGIGAQEQQYRTYPNGALASQLLGFVNDDGAGVYGVEQALNKQLSGTKGELKAVTDVRGVPLAANTDNILIQPVSGSDVVLTVDMAMQKQLEDILKTGLDRAKATQGSALIMEANTGAIKAMANLPTFDPGNYADVPDASVFTNAAASTPLEVGSVMKPLTAAAALQKGAIAADAVHYDPAQYKIDGFTIRNIEEDGGGGDKSIADILNLSLNTGATWMLMRMSGSDDHITQAGRDYWYDFMTNKYRFGRQTGVEQGYEAPGIVPDPDNGYARDLTYANTTFGQAMMATPLQMAAAYAAVLNGGTYYQPRLVDAYVSASGKTTAVAPKVVQKGVVSQRVSSEITQLMQFTVQHHSFARGFDQNAYTVGGKTGTAQIADPKTGTYYGDKYNGTYVGFVGGAHAQYVIVVVVNEPKVGGYAGTAAAQPVFGDLAHMLLDKFNVTPK
ncbi:MAG TPA: penicillin-binding protein 2 [Candidatus Saccharimonadales bacterium]